MITETAAWTTDDEIALLSNMFVQLYLFLPGRRKPVNTDTALRNYAASFWSRKRFSFDPTVVAAWLSNHGYTVPAKPLDMSLRSGVAS